MKWEKWENQTDFSSLPCGRRTVVVVVIGRAKNLAVSFVVCKLQNFKKSKSEARRKARSKRSFTLLYFLFNHSLLYFSLTILSRWWSSWRCPLSRSSSLSAPRRPLRRRCRKRRWPQHLFLLPSNERDLCLLPCSWFQMELRCPKWYFPACFSFRPWRWPFRMLAVSGNPTSTRSRMLWKWNCQLALLLPLRRHHLSFDKKKKNKSLSPPKPTTASLDCHFNFLPGSRWCFSLGFREWPCFANDSCGRTTRRTKTLCLLLLLQLWVLPKKTTTTTIITQQKQKLLHVKICI